jgi:heat-inducible transcriptional repressor
MVHVQFLRLLDGRVLVVLISAGGRTRDKVLRLDRTFTQEELDRTADYLTRHYSGWRLDAIRVDLQARLERERERYDQLIGNALLLCDPGVLASDASREVYVEGAAQIATAAELANPGQLRELLKAIEEKQRLVALLTECIESPEPVHIQIGLKEIAGAGEHLALISAPYTYGQRSRGSLGVLGPMRMQYERAITAVAYLAKVFGQTFAVDRPS